MADDLLDLEPMLQKVVYGRYNVELLFIPFRKEWNDVYGKTILHEFSSLGAKV
jgi:hypothetical protein